MVLAPILPTSGSPTISTAVRTRATRPMAPESRWSLPTPTASEPRRYDSFCNVVATATGLVTVSKTGDSDRAASRISCRVSSSASEATR